jgi:O-antigen/teichoic acid export membrane protein
MSLYLQVVSGARWLGSATAIIIALNLAQTIALSRLLTPRDFGLTGMIWVFLGFAQMFADGGMSAATVQRKDITGAQVSTVHWTNVGLAAALAVLCWLGTPLWVAYYREPDLAPLVPWMAAILVTTSLGHQFRAMAQRDLRFHHLALSEILGAAAAIVVSVIFAVLGAGAHALVYGSLAASSGKTLYLAVTGWRLWRPSLHWSRADLELFLRFGAFQMGARAANYAWNNADYMIIGRLLGSEALGYYRVAYETALRPLATVNPILNTVFFPAFSKKQDDDAALRAGFLDMMRMITMVLAPVLAGLCAVAPLAVVVVFGERWLPVAALLQILSPMGLLRALLNGTSVVTIAKPKGVERLFYIDLTLAAVLPAGIWLAAPYGLRAVCWAGLLLLAAVMVLSWRYLHTNAFGLPLSGYLAAIAKPIAMSAIMVAVVLAVWDYLPAFTAAGPQLAALTAAGAGVYAAGLLVFDRPYLRRLREIVLP